MSASTHVTECGLPGVSTVPYGIHICHFYETRADLAATLVPYFAAGLRRRERCIWITAAPLDAEDAAAELRGAGLDVDAAVRDGSLMIREHSSWYSNAAGLKGIDVVNLWLEEEQRAMAAGHSGLRITGNTSFLAPGDWAAFMEYEELLNRTAASRRIVTLCSYLRERCAPVEMAEVIQRHHCTLDRPDQGWQLLTGDRL